MHLLAVLLICACMHWATCGRSSETKKDAKNPKPVPKPVVFNPDLLPPLTDLFADMQLEKYLPKIVRMGVAETRHLLRLGAMDFRIMSIDWDITPEELERMKAKIAELIALATVKEEPLKDDLKERNALKYGRVYMQGSVMSFEYLSATFGAVAPPLGAFRVAISEPADGCEVMHPDLSGAVLVAKRGNCSFLSKAIAAITANATALIIVNTDDRLDSPSSGLGIDPNVTDAMHSAVSKLAVISTSNNSFAKFAFAAHRGESAMVHMVPLKCVTGGKCAPASEVERNIPMEVASGRLAITAADGGTELVEGFFDFLTSNFGGGLPTGAVRLVVAEEPGMACQPFSQHFLGSLNTDKSPFAVMVRRGGCRFDEKAMIVESSGASLMLVVDPQDGALQRMGGGALSSEVGMPSVLAPAPMADFISSLLPRQLIVTLTPHEGSEIADEWIDVALTNFAEDPVERQLQVEGLVQRFLQSGNADVVAWLRRQAVKMNSFPDEL